MYVQARIDGYGWATRLTTSADHSSRSVGQKIVVSDPAMEGQVKVCRDVRLAPDNCKASPWAKRTS
jgi:hypothetical protein